MTKPERGRGGERTLVAGHGEGGAPTTCADPECVAAAARADRWVGPHCSVEGNGRAHFHHTDVLRANVRANHAAAFQRVCERLDSAPDDFVAAWEYLSRHPIFHRPYPPTSYGTYVEDVTDEQVAELSSPEFVEECDGLRDMLVFVFRDDRNETTVALEHGPHLWICDVDLSQWTRFPTAGQNTCDPALDVSARTYEEAVVGLARKVRVRYGDNRDRIQTAVSDGAGASPDPQQNEAE